MRDSLVSGLKVSAAFLVSGMFTLNTTGVKNGWGPAIFNISSSIMVYGLIKTGKLNDTMSIRYQITRWALEDDPESMEVPQGWLQPEPVESRRLFAQFGMLGLGALSHSINLCCMGSNSSLVLMSYGLIIGSIFGKSLVDLRDAFDMNSEIREGYEINRAYTDRLRDVLNIAPLLLRYTDLNEEQEHNNALAQQHGYLEILNNRDLAKLRRDSCGRLVSEYIRQTYSETLPILEVINNELPLPIADEIIGCIMIVPIRRSESVILGGSDRAIRESAVQEYQNRLNYHFRNNGVREIELLP